MNRFTLLIILFLNCSNSHSDLVCNSIPTTIPEGVQQAAQSVVTVIATYSPEPGKIMVNSASGFLVSTEGRVATNDHVVRKFYQNNNASTENTSYEVTLSNCLTYQADLVFTREGAGFALDLALLDIREPPSGLVPVNFELSRPHLEDTVYAIGTPYGQMNTVVSGKVLSAGPSNYDIVDSIHASTYIQLGNSGGVLVSAVGRVLGMTYGCDGVEVRDGVFVCVRNGYFIPSDYVEKWVDFLERTL